MESINKKNYIPNIDKMKIIANILGLELQEPFQIQFFTHKKPLSLWYKLTETGLIYSYTKDGNYGCKSDAIEGLLIGKHQAIKF
jgi:hypothetical protein